MPAGALGLGPYDEVEDYDQNGEPDDGPLNRRQEAVIGLLVLRVVHR